MASTTSQVTIDVGGTPKEVNAATLTTSASLAIAKANQAVTTKQKALSDAQQAISDANTAVTNAQLDIDQAQLDINQAQLDVSNAQSDLDNANSKSPTIDAPFDGYITAVDVKGGDEVYKGSIAMSIADPTQFEADVLVTENDISNVKLDGEATVSLDALSNINYPAKVTFIAPTATISSGVVNYDVTVTLTSLTPIAAAPKSSQGTAASGMTFPSGTPPAGCTPPAGFTPPTG